MCYILDLFADGCLMKQSLSTGQVQGGLLRAVAGAHRFRLSVGPARGFSKQGGNKDSYCLKTNHLALGEFVTHHKYSTQE